MGRPPFFFARGGSPALRHVRTVPYFSAAMTWRVTSIGDGPGRGDGLDDDLEIGVATRTRPKTKKPSNYKVLMLNDDYTPMEFVVDVLERIFSLDRMRATRVMLEVHTKGKGVCGVYTFEIAETKVAQVMTYARQHQHPLLCTMEET